MSTPQRSPSNLHPWGTIPLSTQTQGLLNQEMRGEDISCTLHLLPCSSGRIYGESQSGKLIDTPPT